MSWKDRSTVIETTEPESVEPVAKKSGWMERSKKMEEEAMGPDFMGPQSTSIGAEGLLNVFDQLASPVRAGVQEVARGPYITGTMGEKAESLVDGLKAAGSQLVDNIKDPFNAPTQAPTYQDIYQEQLTANTVPNLLLNEKEKKGAAFTSGLITDFAVPDAMASVAKGATKLDDYLKRAAGKLKNIERENLATVVAKYQTAGDFEKADIDPERIANVLVENDLTPYAGDPQKIYEALTGEKATTYSKVAENLSKEVVERQPGLIQRKSEDMRKALQEVSDEHGIQIDVPKFANQQVSGLKAEIMGPLSGKVADPAILARMSDKADQLLKPWDEVIVPGVPWSALPEKPAVPPSLPLGDADQFPASTANLKSVEFPKLPSAPEAPKDFGMGRVAISKEVQKKYDTAIKAFDQEVNKLLSEFNDNASKAIKLDDSIMEAKVKQAADRFERKARNNEAYRKEVMENDENFSDTIYQALIQKAMPYRRQWSIRDMMELRTNIGKQLSTTDFMNAAAGDLAPDKMVMEATYDALRANIQKELKGKPVKVGNTTMDAAEFYDVQSTALRRMMEGKEILKKTIKQDWKDPSFSDTAFALGTGTAAAGGAGGIAYLLSGGEGLAIPATVATIAGTRTAYDIAKRGAPAVKARGANLLRRGAELGADMIENRPKMNMSMEEGLGIIKRGMQNNNVMKGIGSGARQIRDNFVVPQEGDEGYMPPQSSYVPARSKSLLEEMGVTELPRNTDELWDMKELVFAKFLQESPDNAPAIIGAAKKGKEQFAKNISFLLNSPDPLTRETMGSMFQDSKYNMIDGQIFDPQMKMLAMDDTRNNDRLTSVQKAQLLNKIQKGEKIV